MDGEPAAPGPAVLVDGVEVVDDRELQQDGEERERLTAPRGRRHPRAVVQLVGRSLTPGGEVWAWGANAAGQLGDGTLVASPVAGRVQGLFGVAAVAAGASHSLALLDDGTVRAWGDNAAGQLGDGTREARPTALPVGGLARVVALAAGERHSLALDAEGAVWAWGGNDLGQLGDGTTEDRLEPVRVTGLPTIRAIAAGGPRSAALDGEGRVWVWGEALDPDAVVGGPVPTDAGLSAIVRNALGEGHLLATDADGFTWAWGRGEDGQLGNGEATSTMQPVHVLIDYRCGGGGGGESPEAARGARAAVEDCGSPLMGAVEVAAGAAHSLARLASGEAWAWGANEVGQLGDGTAAPSAVARVVPGLPAVVGIAAGARHNLAITAEGEVWAWGGNADGQIGDGTLENRRTPVRIAEAGFAWIVPTPVLSPPGGAYFDELAVQVTCVDAEATIHYTLDGTEPTEASPAASPGVPIDVGQSLTVRAKAWKGARSGNVAAASYELVVRDPVITPPGGDFDHPLETVITESTPGAAIHLTTDGTEPTDESPVVLSGGAIPIEADTTIRLRAARPGWTPASTAATFRIITLRPVVDPPGGEYDQELDVSVSSPTAGATILYTTDGTWPSLDSPHLVAGHTIRIDRTTLLRVRAVREGLPDSEEVTPLYTLRVSQPIASPPAGAYDAPQQVWLQSPTGGAVVRYELGGAWPTALSPILTGPVLVDATTRVTAAAYRQGWLASSLVAFDYEIRDATGVAAPTFSPPPGHYATARQVTIQCPTSGSEARYTTDGTDPTEASMAVGCGASILVDRTTPLKARAWKAGLEPSEVRSGLYRITGAVAASAVFTLALRTDGTVWAWGANDRGFLGDGTTVQRDRPVRVGTPPGIVAIAAGRFHALAIDGQGRVWAWGDNSQRQLGPAVTGAYSASPVLVTGLANVTAIAAGWQHSLALESDGTVWAWGLVSGRATPTPEREDNPYEWGSLSTAIAADQMNLKIDGQGQVWAWTSLSWDWPDRVGVDADAVAAGSFYGIDLLRALRGSGSGVGEIWDLSTKTPIPGAPLATAIDVGAFDLALDATGRLWAWGPNEYGQLGLGFFGGSVPPSPVDSGEDVVDFSAGWSHGVAVKADGSIWTWGEAFGGRLGDGSTTRRAVPLPIDGFTVADNGWVGDDPDGDGLSSAREQFLGCDPFVADTNVDGLLDGVSVQMGLSCSSPDTDGDGLLNADEIARGTDPLKADTDGDGVVDGVDCWPLDPSRSECLPPNPGDVTPPNITLTLPPGAVLVSTSP